MHADSQADITPDARTDPAAPGPAPVALQSAALTQAAQMPQHAMAQVAAALIRTMADGRKSTELRLDPEELGQVRMRLSVIDGALTVTLLADRGETLELMRRNIDLLSRDLHQSGYDNARFVFPQGDTERNDRHQAESSRAPAPLVNATDLPDMPGSVLVTLDDRLDIRL